VVSESLQIPRHGESLVPCSVSRGGLLKRSKSRIKFIYAAYRPLLQALCSSCHFADRQSVDKGCDLDRDWAQFILGSN
jgi:hypothetical protein